MIAGKVKVALSTGKGRVNRAWKMVIVFYLANLGVALILAVPMLQALNSSLRGTTIEERVLADFDYDWFSNFKDTQPGWMESLDLSLIGPGAFLRNYEMLLEGKLTQVNNPILGLGLLYWMMQVFMAGGALHILCTHDGRFKLIDFFSGCGLFFFRFLRLGVLCLIIYAILFGALHAPMKRLFDALTENMGSERVVFSMHFLKYLAAAGVVALLGMVFDYAKIRTVQDGRRSAIFSFISALYFVIRNARKAVLLYAVLLLVGLLIAAGYGFLERSLPVVSALTVLLAFFLQQAFVVSKMWLKLLFYSSQFALYQTYKTERGQ